MVTEVHHHDSELTRREFCNSLLLTSTGLLVAAAMPTSEAVAQEHQSVDYPPVKIEGAERLMPGSSLDFSYPNAGNPAILVRTEHGDYYAFNRKCSHLGCSIFYSSTSRRLECPCHKGAYDAQTGFVLNGPPIRPLNLIVLQMRAGSEVWAVGRRIGTSEGDYSNTARGGSRI